MKIKLIVLITIGLVLMSCVSIRKTYNLIIVGDHNKVETGVEAMVPQDYDTDLDAEIDLPLM